VNCNGLSVTASGVHIGGPVPNIPALCCRKWCGGNWPSRAGLLGCSCAIVVGRQPCPYVHSARNLRSGSFFFGVHHPPTGPRTSKPMFPLGPMQDPGKAPHVPLLVCNARRRVSGDPSPRQWAFTAFKISRHFSGSRVTVSLTERSLIYTAQKAVDCGACGQSHGTPTILNLACVVGGSNKTPTHPLPCPVKHHALARGRDSMTAH